MSLWSAWEDLVTYGSETAAPGTAPSNEEAARIKALDASKQTSHQIAIVTALVGLVAGIWLMKR